MGKDTHISNDQMIFSIDELKAKGFSYYKIGQMVQQEILIKLNRKYYENTIMMVKNQIFIMRMHMFPMGWFVF